MFEVNVNLLFMKELEAIYRQADSLEISSVLKYMMEA
jgi:hypothetical protein